MTGEPNGDAVRITNRDIWDAVQTLDSRVNDTLTELRRHVDQAGHQPSVHQIADHESRIRRLEAWRYAIPTAAVIAVGSVVIGLIEGTH